MTELESLLERALTGNAERIDHEALARPHLAQAAPARSGRAGLRVTLAAAAVAAVASGTALIAVHGLPSPSPGPVGVRPSAGASTGPTAGALLPSTGEHRYVGRRWVVVAVESGGVRHEVPAQWRAVIVFGRSGGLQIDDSVNALWGSYSLTPRGFRVTLAGTTFVGYGGGDPAREAQLAALDRIEGVRQDQATPPDDTRVTWHGPRLILSNAGSSLELIEDPGCSSRAPVICPGAPTP